MKSFVLILAFGLAWPVRATESGATSSNFTVDTSAQGFADTRDEDGDDLPDWWEQKYNLNDPAGDADGDGLSNSEEFRRGTDPTRPDRTPLQNNFSKMFTVDTGGQFSDSDADGLPDWWERSHFAGLSAGGNEDSDHDGHNNREEYLAGTNPTDPQSVLKITSAIPQSPVALVITWNAMEQRKYHLESSLEFESAFHVIHSNILATPPQNAFTTSLTAAKAFYRITVAP